MTIAPGSRLGPYEITALIGEGGMGKVWRAHHTALKRDDALKVLPDAFASDPERLARFRREAQVLASLNHPNIAHVYGLEQSDGIQALVMELVEGPTLADRIAQGPIAIDEALPIAKQIAEALEAAHEQGIIHRDLKPANIKVRPDGTVKVLDFGMAKALEPMSARVDATASPTITSPAMMTGVGVLLGTAAYMSPEQARGKVVDQRADIWAFGCVLYEMLTGQRTFGGEDVTDTLAAVVRAEPAWDALPNGLSPSVLVFLRRCLEKNPKQRLHNIADMRLALEGAFETAAIRAADPVVFAQPLWRRALPAAALIALTAVVVGAAVWTLRPAPIPAVVAQFSISVQEGLFAGTSRQAVAISPDGQRIAYVADAQIYLRSIRELDAQVVQGTKTGGQGLVNPMFAPDGESIAFIDLPASSVKRVPIRGGNPSTVIDMETAPLGASWGPQGILIAGDPRNQRERGILRVSPTGGAPELIVRVSADEIAWGPQMLPNGRTVLFTLAKGMGEDRWDKGQIVAYSIADGTRRVVIEGGSDARYLPTGHLVYAVAGTLFAAPFDPERLTVTGPALPVIEGVRRSTVGQTGATHVAVSQTGTLVYLPGPTIVANSRTFGLVLGDNRSDAITLKIPPGPYRHPRMSSDGRVLAVERRDGEDFDIWTYDLSETTAIRRLTFGGSNRFPVWSADSRRVTFQSRREGDRAIFWQPVEGGVAERLTRAAEGEEHIPESWSRDGRYLFFSIAKQSRYSLWVLTLKDRKVEPFGALSSGEALNASFSPDGRWVAYAFTERPGGGTSPNRGIFVEPFPATGEKYQLPKSVVDFHPVWAPDGKNIFYVPTGARLAISVPIITQPTVAFGTPVELTLGPRPGLPSFPEFRGYDFLRDGRFVSLSEVFGETPGSAGEMRVVLNWTEELKRLVPTN